MGITKYNKGTKRDRKAETTKRNKSKKISRRTKIAKYNKSQRAKTAKHNKGKKAGIARWSRAKSIICYNQNYIYKANIYNQDNFLSTSKITTLSLASSHISKKSFFDITKKRKVVAKLSKTMAFQSIFKKNLFPPLCLKSCILLTSLYNPQNCFDGDFFLILIIIHWFFVILLILIKSIFFVKVAIKNKTEIYHKFIILPVTNNNNKIFTCIRD